MEKTANILLYVGTILIAFQIVGNIGFVSTIISLPLAIPIPFFLKKFTQKYTGKRRAVIAKKTGYFSLFLLTTLVFITVGVALSPIIILYTFVGRPLLFLNKALNIIYRKSVEPWKDFYLTMLRATLKANNVKKKLSNDDLWKITFQKEVPFLALFGVVCVTIGFVFQLISK